MGRLEEIIDRNKHPRKHRKMRFPVGIMLAAFVLLVLVLMIFTDAGLSPGVPPAGSPAAGATQAPSGEKRIDGVLLYRAPAKRAGAQHDAGADVGPSR